MTPAEQMREAAVKIIDGLADETDSPNARFCLQAGSSAIRALPLPPEPEPRQYAPDSFDALITAAREEAVKAMRKFPQPNYVISKIAEEAGEVVKAAIHCAEGRETADNVRGEMKQLVAMLYRLWVEGDGVHGLATVGDDPHPINNLPPEPEPPIVAELEAALRRIIFDWDGEPEDMAQPKETLANLAAWKAKK